MGQIGQTPMAQQMQGAIMAHIAEHLAFQYRQKVQEQLGATLPAPDAQLDNNVEVQVSKLVAQAATQLLQMDKAKAAQQQAMAQAQDPIIQMQQAELQIKKQEADTKAAVGQGSQGRTLQQHHCNLLHHPPQSSIVLSSLQNGRILCSCGSPL